MIHLESNTGRSLVSQIAVCSAKVGALQNSLTSFEMPPRAMAILARRSAQPE